jgi:hypothetical protein
MAKKRNNASIPFDAIGEDLAKVLDIKRRLVETGIQCGDPEYARGILDEVRNFVRCVREELETQLHHRSLEDMTPKQAQQAICGCRIFEESLRVTDSAHPPASTMLRFVRSAINRDCSSGDAERTSAGRVQKFQVSE